MLCLLLIRGLLEKLICTTEHVIESSCREFTCNLNSCHHICRFIASSNLASCFAYPVSFIKYNINYPKRGRGRKKTIFHLYDVGYVCKQTMETPLVQTHWISRSFYWVGGGARGWTAGWPTRDRQGVQPTTLADSFDICQSPRPPTLRPSPLRCFCCLSPFLLSQCKILRHNLGME